MKIVQIFEGKILHCRRGMIPFSAAATYSFVGKFEIGFDALAAGSFNLVSFNWPQRLSIGRGPVVQIEPPKDACETDGSTSPFQNERLLVTAVKKGLRCCGGNPAPAINIRCVHRPKVWKIAARILR